MIERGLRVPFILACAGCAGLLVTVVSAARTDVTKLGGGLVFNTILGVGMMASGLLLISGAVTAKRLVSQGAAERTRRNSLFFAAIGVIGVVTTLYGAAMFGVMTDSSLHGGITDVAADKHFSDAASPQWLYCACS